MNRIAEECGVQYPEEYDDLVITRKSQLREMDNAIEEARNKYDNLARTYNQLLEDYRRNGGQ